MKLIYHRRGNATSMYFISIKKFYFIDFFLIWENISAHVLCNRVKNRSQHTQCHEILFRWYKIRLLHKRR